MGNLWLKDNFGCYFYEIIWLINMLVKSAGCPTQYLLILFVVFFDLSVFSVNYSSAAPRETLVVSSIPWQNEETLRSTYAPLLMLLEEKLNVETKLVIPEDYQSVGASLLHEGADIGILGGNAYVTLKDRYPQIHYLATCKQPTAFYRSLIITKSDSGIDSLADLEGAAFGFTDRQSTSGYIFPKILLADAGCNSEQFFSSIYFLNKHDKVYDAVAKGSIAGGAVSSTAYKKAVERNGDVYTILVESAPIPRNAVVGAPHLTQKELSVIRTILENAEYETVFSDSNSILKGFLIREDSFYDTVRKIKRQH